MSDNNESTLTETPGIRIRRAREANGLSQIELAAKIGVSKQAVDAMEIAGATNFPKLPNALKIAKALGVSAWYIAFGYEEPAATPNAGLFVGDGGAPEQVVTQGQLQSFRDELDTRLAAIEIALGLPPPEER